MSGRVHAQPVKRWITYFLPEEPAVAGRTALTSQDAPKIVSLGDQDLGRVALGSYPPRAPTDPDVRNFAHPARPVNASHAPVHRVDHPCCRQRHTAPASPTGSPSRSGPSSYAGKATSARSAPRSLAYGSTRHSSPSPRSRHRGHAASGSVSRAAPGSAGAGSADTTPLSLSRTGGFGWLPSVS